MSVPVKRIKERVLRIQTAWNEGAADVTEFRNTKKSEFDAAIAEAQAVDDEIAELRARLGLKEDERDLKYSRLDDMAVDVREGVIGDKNFGKDSPLIGEMGFVRSSERDSGLTHDTDKDEPDDESEK